MKRSIVASILLTSLLMMLVSCNKAKEFVQLVKKDNDTIVVYDPIQYKIMYLNKKNNGKLKLIDTACINGEKRAKIEAQRGIYTYYYGAGYGFTESPMKYLKDSFSAKGIRIDFYYTSCVGGAPLGAEFGEHCYIKAAKAEFREKYGQTRIDSMKKAYEKLIKKYYHR